MALARTKPVILTFGMVIEETGTPPRTWLGHAAELAVRLVRRRLIEGLPRKGFYLGPVVPDCPVKGQGGCVRHGWVETFDGRLCDPLRWSFEGTAPYLFLGRDELGYYDANGELTRARFAVHPPPFDSKALRLPACPCYNCDLFVRRELLCGSPAVTLGQARYVAALDPVRLGDWAVHIYRWLIQSGHGELIPLLHRAKVIGPLSKAALASVD